MGSFEQGIFLTWKDKHLQMVRKMTNPKISVIMSVYNGEKYLREAIESILNQTFTDFEFIIVNDGSTDGSLEIIQSYDDKRIKIINNEKNIGLTKSLNKALKVARGEYIARQDADDVSLPNRFEKQIKYLEKHPEVALLGTSVYLIDEKGKIIGKRMALAKPTFKELCKGNRFSHGSVMFEKAVITELGGYNELLRYVQDYELWLRIAKSYEIRNLTQVLYKWRFHSKRAGFMAKEEYPLYHILALRLANNNGLSESMLKALKEGNIRSSFLDLNKEEKIYFHKTMANFHIHNNNLKAAREEYKKIFALNPLDITNDINIARSYLGKSVMAKSSKIYGSFINFLQHLKNCWSR